MPQCIVRGISTALSMGIIYLAGLVLSVAGSFMNGVLALTTVDFNASVYTYVAPGIEAVWTVFRDIANIIIIGMFTFIALSMILGIEKFNARQSQEIVPTEQGARQQRQIRKNSPCVVV